MRRTSMRVHPRDFLAIAFATFLASRAAEQPANLAHLIDPGGLPLRVHVFEDFETEIEKRWWLAGTPETENLAPSLSRSVPNTRCMRAGDTKNYDDKKEDQSRI